MRARHTSLADRHILATAVHELRNTLSPLSNAVDLLLSETDPERRAWAVRIAKRQISCLGQLVSDMSEVGSCAGRPQPISRERLVLQQIVKESITACAPLFAARAQQAWSVLESEPLWVEADPVRLTQVLSNLMTNASKYTPRGGHIRVSCAKADPDKAEIAVVDDGVGIAPENLPRVFDLFYREDRAKGLAGGLGVGLSVVDTLVHAHGGEVWAESSGPGTGSRFVVRLPLLTASVATN